MEKKPFFKRNSIFGLVGLIWGCAIIIYRISGQTPVAGNQSYAAGQNAAFLFGILLVTVGLYYLRKG